MSLHFSDISLFLKYFLGFMSYFTEIHIHYHNHYRFRNRYSLRNRYHCHNRTHYHLHNYYYSRNPGRCHLSTNESNQQQILDKYEIDWSANNNVCCSIWPPSSFASKWQLKYATFMLPIQSSNMVQIIRINLFSS